MELPVKGTREAKLLMAQDPPGDLLPAFSPVEDPVVLNFKLVPVLSVVRVHLEKGINQKIDF